MADLSVSTFLTPYSGLYLILVAVTLILFVSQQTFLQKMNNKLNMLAIL